MADAEGLDGSEIPLPPFTRDGYRRLISELLDHGYNPTTFANVRKERRDLIIRHDVDVCLEAAVTIAEIEHDMGVAAIYFVMVSNSFYNIYSYEGQRLVDRLSKMGHAVGLHFDPTPYLDDRDRYDYRAAAAHEARLLSAIVDHPLEIISFHHPPRELVNWERPPGSPPHTYEPRFFSDLAYVSDSGGRWRFGGPFDRPAFRDGTAMHLLTHPIWWAHDEPVATPALVLDRFVAGYRQRLEKSLSRGFNAYREFLMEREAEE